MKKKSIRYYFFTSIAAVLVASVLVLGMIQLYLSITYFRQEKDHTLRKIVISVQEDVAAGGSTLDVSYTDYMSSVTDAQVYVVRPDGGILYDTVTHLVHEPPQQYIPEEILEKVSSAELYYKERGTLGSFFERPHSVIAAGLYNNTGSLIGYVFASSDELNVRSYMSDMFSSFFLSAGLVMLVASILTLVLTNRTVIPVRRVSNAARRFGEGDYSARVPVEGDDELAQLAVTFNEMAASCEATDASRRSFMGNIAHELRTPMTSIKGFIDGMLDGTIPEDQRDKYLGVVSEEVGRLARLTQNMLDISKLEAGEYVPNTTSFDIWQPIASVFLGAEQRLDGKKVEVLGLRTDEPVLVLADEDFVYQVLFNILDNAIKFVEEGGIITASVTRDKGFATITIHNTGSGISPEVLSKIFERFYKEDSSRGLNARGAGLGLHICRVLVGLMGGRIWAESEEGRWTAFHFTLPLAPSARWGGNLWSEAKIKETATGSFERPKIEPEKDSKK